MRSRARALAVMCAGAAPAIYTCALLCAGCGSDTTAPRDETRIIVHPDRSGDYPTIQNAIDAAAMGETIYLAPGVFAGSGQRDLDFQGKRLVLRSLDGDPSSVTIDCGGSMTEPHRGFIFHTSEQPGATVAGLTIAHGWAAEGGAVLCTTVSTPTFSDCIFEDNAAAESGGAIRLSDFSSATFENCVFRRNTAGSSGGAIHAAESSPTLRGCSFDSNLAAEGGALACSETLQGRPLSVESCTFYGDESGAIACRAGSITVRRTIIAFGVDGPAVRCGDGCAADLACCDLFGNSGGDWVDCIAGQAAGAGNFSADPLFCDPANGDLRLDPASPCAAAVECGTLGAWPAGCGQ